METEKEPSVEDEKEPSVEEQPGTRRGVRPCERQILCRFGAVAAAWVHRVQSAESGGVPEAGEVNLRRITPGALEPAVVDRRPKMFCDA